MRYPPNSQSVVLSKTSAPAANTKAVATLTPGAEETYVVRQIFVSYGVAAPTASVTLIVKIAGTTAFTKYLPKAIGTWSFHYDDGLYGAAGEQVVCTLLAGAGAANATKGTLNVLYQ